MTSSGSADTWTQTSALDFQDGESFFVETSEGSIKLERGLNNQWFATGEGTYEYFGDSIASAGDVNGDGYHDVLVGASGNDDGGNQAGKVYLYLGSSTGLERTAAWTAIGEDTANSFGDSISGAGDVNGDGYDDVIIGAHYNDDSGSWAGKAYVYHGSPSGLSTSADWTKTGENANDEFGYRVSGAGDVNGDGYADVMVNALRYSSSRGKVYVYHGSSSGIESNPNWTKIGENSNDYFGDSMDGAGDVNGDGFDDIIIGAPAYDVGDDYNAGKAYVYHGSSSGVSATSNWQKTGQYGYDRFGTTVSGAGDVNDDGYADVIIGAPSNDDAGDNAGKVYAYHGSSSGIANLPTMVFRGFDDSDQFGYSLSNAGDVNADGYADILIGSFDNIEAGQNYGSAYLYHGGSRGLDGAASWIGCGEGAGEYYGATVADAGDVDGDGYADVLVGAYYSSRASNNGGCAYLYQYKTEIVVQKMDLWQVIGEEDNDRLGNSLASAGDVNGDGCDDVILGSAHNDEAGDQAGKAYLYLGSSSGLHDTEDWNDTGESTYSRFGDSVACAGAVNGDGFDDVIIGASYHDSYAGSAYVYYGSRSGLSSSYDWSYTQPANYDYLGRVVSGAGDVNGDGYDDVIVGAWGNDTGGTQAGAAYVFHGSASGLGSSPDWSQYGSDAGDTFGRYVSSAGDVNNDGYHDVLVGAPDYETGGADGAAYMYLGSESGLASSASWTFEGDSENTKVGEGVCTAGDVNGDGYDDVVIGSTFDDPSNTGKAQIFHGNSNALNSNPSWSVTGEVSGDYYGIASQSAGDVNGDGYDDLIVGAKLHDAAAATGGKAYLYLGGPDGLDAAPSWTALGEADNDRFGTIVSSAGDVNNDGLDEILVGAEYNDDGGDDNGKVYLYSAPEYFRYGTFESEPFGNPSCCSDAVNWVSFHWDPAVQPEDTIVRFHIGTSDDGRTWDYTGPDGTPSSYYTANNNEIHAEVQGEFWRYKAYLYSDPDHRFTPEVDEISVNYVTYDKPTVTLHSPNGGENLMENSTHVITWEATGEFGLQPVTLYYSVNGGSTWNEITASTFNNYNYQWTTPEKGEGILPDDGTQLGLVLIIVTDEFGNTARDISERTFSIDPPPEGTAAGSSVTSPFAGDQFEPGTTVPIQWDLPGEEQISISYSMDFGQNWNTIVEDIGNFGQYHWEIPADLVSNNVVLRIQGEQSAIDSGVFMIQSVEIEGNDTPGNDEKGEDALFEGMGLSEISIVSFVALLFISLAAIMKYRTGSQAGTQAHPGITNRRIHQLKNDLDRTFRKKGENNE